MTARGAERATARTWGFQQEGGLPTWGWGSPFHWNMRSAPWSQSLRSRMPQQPRQNQKNTANPKPFNVLIVVAATLIVHRHKNTSQCILKKEQILLIANFSPHETKKKSVTQLFKKCSGKVILEENIKREMLPSIPIGFLTLFPKEKDTPVPH